MKTLTEKQEFIFDCIKDFIKENEYSPSIRELCEIANLKSPASVFSHLVKLRDKGYITYVDGKNRTIRIIKEVE